MLAGSTGVVAAIALLIGFELVFGGSAGHTRPVAGAIAATAQPGARAVDPRPTHPVSPSPTVSGLPTVPAQPVSTLITGDCLQTYPSPWANGYPVVDCAEPHIAQVLSTGTLPQASGALFPGATAVRDEVNPLCSSTDLLNWDWVAIWNEDVQIDLRYPNTSAQWASGARTYYCFIYTQSRHELTGSAVASH